MLPITIILLFISHTYSIICPAGTYTSISSCITCPSHTFSYYNSNSCSICSNSDFIHSFTNNILSQARYDLSSEASGNIIIYAGGYDGGSIFYNNVDIFNINTQIWTTSILSTSRSSMGSCSYINGIMFAGGLGTGTLYKTADFYDIDTLTWISYESGLSVARYDLACTALGYLGLCSGGQGSTPSNVVDYFNSSSKNWRSSNDLSIARSALSATTCNNYALFAGGRLTGTTRKSTIDIYSFEFNSWTNLVNGLSISRDQLTSTSIGNLCIFAGGQITVTAEPSDRVDIFNSTDNSWITYSLSTPRYSLASSNSGCKAVFIGGYDGSTVFSTIDIFDSNSNSWSTMLLTTPRYLFATSTINGHIMIGGGLYISPLRSVEFLSTCSIGASLVNFNCICPIGTYDNGTHCANCPAGYFGNITGLISRSCSGICQAGYYGAGGSTSSFCDGKCSLGYYCSDASPSPTQFPCSPGHYGNTVGLTTSTCSGVCADGYYCTAGSTSVIQHPCDAGHFGIGLNTNSSCSGACSIGYYCTAGSSSPTSSICPPGVYGNSTGLSSLACSGQCIHGYYGSSTGLTLATCSGLCNILGFYCPYNSTSPSQYPCNPGYYGNTTGLTSSNCSGSCAVGFYCPSNSTSPFQAPCPAGVYGNTTGLSSSSCSGNCLAGYYGNSTSMTKATCDGICEIGYYCPGLFSTSSILCLAGYFGNSTGLTVGTCTGACSIGFYCPGGSTTSTSIPCAVGSYGNSTGSSSPECSGFCGNGYYGDSIGLSSITCSGPCDPGYICKLGSKSAKNEICTPGKFSSSGASVCSNCAAGTYGVTAGLTSSACSSLCHAGYFCLEASINMTLCPVGKFSNTGLSTCILCDAGFYGINTGMTSSQCSGPCDKGYYCLAGSTTSTQFSCGVGFYGDTGGMTNSKCSGQCQDGYITAPGMTSSTCGGCNSCVCDFKLCTVYFYLVISICIFIFIMIVGYAIWKCLSFYAPPKKQIRFAIPDPINADLVTPGHRIEMVGLEAAGAAQRAKIRFGDTVIIENIDCNAMLTKHGNAACREDDNNGVWLVICPTLRSVEMMTELTINTPFYLKTLDDLYLQRTQLMYEDKQWNAGRFSMGFSSFQSQILSITCSTSDELYYGEPIGITFGGYNVDKLHPDNSDRRFLTLDDIDEPSCISDQWGAGESLKMNRVAEYCKPSPRGSLNLISFNNKSRNSSASLLNSHMRSSIPITPSNIGKINYNFSPIKD